MLKIIIVVCTAVLLTVVLVKVIDRYLPSKYRRSLLLSIWLLIAFLCYKTFASIYTPILFNKTKEKRYTEVIKSLIDIRDSQIAYKTINGKFAEDFNELIKFIDTAKYTITQRRNAYTLDSHLTKKYGSKKYKEVVLIDTLGFVFVKDSLFKGSNRYKKMMYVPVGKKGAKFELDAGTIVQNKLRMPVFEARVKKSIILFDQDKDLVNLENKVVSMEEVNGDALKVGSMTEVKTNGNWPKNYGNNN